MYILLLASGFQRRKGAVMDGIMVQWVWLPDSQTQFLKMLSYFKTRRALWPAFNLSLSTKEVIPTFSGTGCGNEGNDDSKWLLLSGWGWIKFSIGRLLSNVFDTISTIGFSLLKEFSENVVNGSDGFIDGSSEKVENGFNGWTGGEGFDGCDIGTVNSTGLFWKKLLVDGGCGWEDITSVNDDIGMGCGWEEANWLLLMVTPKDRDMIFTLLDTKTFEDWRQNQSTKLKD